MLPSIAALHPLVVHGAIALLLLGVLFRIVSLFGSRFSWASPAATTLIIIGTGASILAVRSGIDAHGPVERIPGVRDAVVEHEEAGEYTRNLFLGVAALELVALALRDSRRRRWLQIGSAVVGVAGSVALVRAADLGGDLVYSYAGGVGIRTGDPQDVQRLYTAGLYNMAQLERKRGNDTGAASLVQELERRHPGDPTVALLRAESLTRDLHDPSAALARLDSLERGSKPDPRLAGRIAFLRADALVAAGRKDSARAVLAALQQQQPQNPRLQAKLDSLKD